MRIKFDLTLLRLSFVFLIALLHYYCKIVLLIFPYLDPSGLSFVKYKKGRWVGIEAETEVLDPLGFRLVCILSHSSRTIRCRIPSSGRKGLVGFGGGSCRGSGCRFGFGGDIDVSYVTACGSNCCRRGCKVGNLYIGHSCLPKR